MLLVASCSSSDQDKASDGSSSAASDAAAASVPASPTPVVALSEQTTVLTCAYSAHPTTLASAADVNASGLTFSGVEPVHKRLSSPMPVSDGAATMLFEKVLLYVSTSASPTTRVHHPDRASRRLPVLRRSGDMAVADS